MVTVNGNGYSGSYTTDISEPHSDDNYIPYKRLMNEINTKCKYYVTCRSMNLTDLNYFDRGKFYKEIGNRQCFKFLSRNNEKHHEELLKTCISGRSTDDEHNPGIVSTELSLGESYTYNLLREELEEIYSKAKIITTKSWTELQVYLNSPLSKTNKIDCFGKLYEESYNILRLIKEINELGVVNSVDFTKEYELAHLLDSNPRLDRWIPRLNTLINGVNANLQF